VRRGLLLVLAVAAAILAFTLRGGRARSGPLAERGEAAASRGPAGTEAPPAAPGASGVDDVPRSAPLSGGAPGAYEAAVQAVETAREDALARLAALHAEGKLKEGYEACLSFLDARDEGVGASVRRLVGLRALPLFSPPGSPWRGGAYARARSAALGPSTGREARKESLCALAGLRSLALEVSPGESAYPVSILDAAEALDATDGSTDFSRLVGAASFRDLALADGELRAWLAARAVAPEGNDLTAPRESVYDTRQACVLAIAAIRGPEEAALLRKLAWEEPDEGVRYHAVASLTRLAANRDEEARGEFFRLIAVERSSMALALAARELDKIEWRYDARVAAVLDRVEGTFARREPHAYAAYVHSLRLAAHYYVQGDLGAERRLELRDRLLRLLPALPSWDRLPQPALDVARLGDPALNEALRAILPSLKDSSGKRRCAEILSAGK
jgi:hypothetical protein